MALRGSYPVRLDDKGRLKIPAEYRAYLESTYGSRVFMTSDDEETVRIYPLPIWEGIETKLAAAPTTEESVTKYLDLVNYYGSSGEFDAQGRLVISPRLRTMAGIDQDVEMFGKVRWLEIWSQSLVGQRIKAQKLTAADRMALKALGI